MRELSNYSNLVRTNLANFSSGGALLFSWLAIISLLEDKFSLSFGLILLAFVFDTLDGYLARRLKIDNPLGQTLDGYVDVVNYLIYPAIAFFIQFRMDSMFSVMIIFVFLGAGVFRLARFEIQGLKKVDGKMHYEGLPVFFNPLLVLIFWALSFLLTKTIFIFLATTLLLAVSFLMVQKFKFPKPKNAFPVIVGTLILGLIFLVNGLGGI